MSLPSREYAELLALNALRGASTSAIKSAAVQCARNVIPTACLGGGALVLGNVTTLAEITVKGFETQDRRNQSKAMVAFLAQIIAENGGAADQVTKKLSKMLAKAPTVEEYEASVTPGAAAVEPTDFSSVDSAIVEAVTAAVAEVNSEVEAAAAPAKEGEAGGVPVASPEVVSNVAFVKLSATKPKKGQRVDQVAVTALHAGQQRAPLVVPFTTA